MPDISGLHDSGLLLRVHTRACVLLRVHSWVHVCVPVPMCRHSFEYQFPTNASTALYAKAQLVWTRAATAGPVKLVSAAFGNDLGLDASLYPSNNLNYDFAGSLEFASQVSLALLVMCYVRTDSQFCTRAVCRYLLSALRMHAYATPGMCSTCRGAPETADTEPRMLEHLCPCVCCADAYRRTSLPSGSGSFHRSVPVVAFPPFVLAPCIHATGHMHCPCVAP